MSQKLFENLPNLIYNNKLVKDITRRAKLVDNAPSVPFVLYPYEIRNNLRSDIISEFYYGDSQLDWLIYMTNDIFDPYWEWYLTDEQIEEKLKSNFGSVETAMKKIKFYRNNWANDDSEISASFYENNLALSWKKYYVPSQWKTSVSYVTKGNNKETAVYSHSILTYKRKQMDVIVNTNRHIDFSIQSNTSSVAFSNGELADIKVYGGTTETVGTCEVLISNSSTIRVRHVAGNTSANSTHMKYIVGETSGANCVVNNSVVAVKTIESNNIITTTKLENFDESEGVFWSPVTYYDWEIEQNEARKLIVLPSAGIKDLMIQKFQERLQENMDPVTKLSQS